MSFRARTIACPLPASPGRAAARPKRRWGCCFCQSLIKTPRGTQVEKFNFTGDRYRVRSLAALRALNMLRKALTDIDEVTISD